MWEKWLRICDCYKKDRHFLSHLTIVYWKSCRSVGVGNRFSDLCTCGTKSANFGWKQAILPLTTWKVIDQKKIGFMMKWALSGLIYYRICSKHWMQTNSHLRAGPGGGQLISTLMDMSTNFHRNSTEDEQISAANHGNSTGSCWNRGPFFSHPVENVLEFCPNIGLPLSKSQKMKSWIRPCFYGNHQWRRTIELIDYTLGNRVYVIEHDFDGKRPVQRSNLADKNSELSWSST